MLIPAYKDMDPYDLPEEFSHLQAQDMSKLGFMQDLIRGIKKITQADEPKATVVKETVIAGGNANTMPLLKRAFMFLEDGDWSSADEYCEKVLDIELECAEAYLGKLMAELGVKRKENLKNQKVPFNGHDNYKKAVRFAEAALKEELEGDIEFINARNENDRLEGIYNAAKNNMAQGTVVAYEGAAKQFASISNFKDSALLEKECLERGETLRKDSILSNAVSRMSGTYIGNCEYALSMLKSIPGWRNADEKAAECRRKIEELTLAEKRRKEEDRIREEQIKKKIKKFAAIAAPIAVAVIVFIMILTSVIIPNGKYNDAVALMEEGKYSEAYEMLISLGGYKDSSDKASSVYDKLNNLEKLKFAKAKTVDYVFFGAYEQYNTSFEDATWETCTLRKWLNNDFINLAFSDVEKEMIPIVTVSADKNPKHSTDHGNATQDQVFLLSISEAEKYFSSYDARECKPTEYAVANGAYSVDNGNCWWWLRSPGYRQDFAAYVRSGGTVNEDGSSVYNSIDAVRPALWIDLNS